MHTLMETNGNMKLFNKYIKIIALMLKDMRHIHPLLDEFYVSNSFEFP